MPLPCFHHEGSSTAYLRRSLDCTSLALFVRGGGPGLLKHNRCLPKLTPIPCPSLSLFLSPPFSRSFFHPLSLTFSLTFSLFSLSLSLILSLSLSSLFSLSLSLFHSPAPLSFSLSPHQLHKGLVLGPGAATSTSCWTFSHAFLSTVPPPTCRVTYSHLRPFTYV